jgi:5-oxoprolinase (ATP-hydrolysing)
MLPERGESIPTASTHHSVRRVLSLISGEIPKDQPLPLDQVESIRMGTTVSTNALLERKGERCALITTKGYGDALLIGTQGKRLRRQR